MRTTLEREVKLDFDSSFALPELPGEELERRIFTSTYHDNPARSLGYAGITLRRRVENGKSLWQLKLPHTGGLGVARTELEEAGGPAGPPAEFSRLLAAHLRHGKLAPVATLRTRRSGVHVIDGERSVAEVTFDAVDILDAGHAAGSFAEIEVELVGDGTEADLERLDKTLRRAGARRSAGLPKLMRVMALEDAGAPPADAPLDVHLHFLLTAQLRELEAHDPGVRLGDDPEDVHGFRVATRRTRALIRETRPLLGDVLEPLEAELKWLAAILGPVRDLDVLIDRLSAEVALLDDDEPAGRHLLEGLESQRTAGRERLLEALLSDRYVALLGTFESAIEALPSLTAEGAAVGIARDGFRKLREAATKLPHDPSDDELHALRIRVKRARYAAELAALGGGKSATRAVDALKNVQDVIGAHQDAVVAETALRKLARARTAVAAGRLVERERTRRRAMRKAYPDALAAALAAGKKAFG